MVKGEKVNRRTALYRVNTNVESLKKSNHTLKDVYDIIFSHPDFTFLNVVNSYGYDEVTYAKAKSYSECFAAYFLENIKGEYVGILMDNSKEWIYSFFGLLRGGFTPVLFSTANGFSEVESVSKKLGIKYLITDKKVPFEINTINPFNIKYVEKNWQFDSDFANKIVFLTSGTTGEPKIVFYNGEEVCNQIYNAAEILKEYKNIGRDYKGLVKHLVILPFYHIFGLFAVLLWFSFFNIPFVLPTSLNPKSIKQACLLCRPTHIFAVPLFWENVVSLINAKVDTEKKQKKLNKAFKLSASLQNHFGYYGTHLVRDRLFKKYLNEIFGPSIRFCVSGGAFLNEEALRTINLLGYPLVNGYGSTEIGITSLNDSNSLKKRLSLSIGKSFNNVDYKVEDGKLYVHAPSSSKHIIDKNNEIFLKSDDWINTLDEVKEDNGELFLLGREDEIIIGSDGENLSIPLIEKQISLSKCEEFAVIEFNNKLILIASYNKLTPIPLVIEELNAVNNKHINAVYYTNKELPKANSLKIKRNELKQLLSGSPYSFILLKDLKEKGEELSSSIDDELLATVVAVFKKVFPDHDIKPNSHFYTELGGDSLKYYVLVGEVEESIGCELKMNPEHFPVTPEEFVKVIER